MHECLFIKVICICDTGFCKKEIYTYTIELLEFEILELTTFRTFRTFDIEF